MKRSLLLFLLNILIISFFSQEVFSLSDNSGQRDISSFVKKDGRENPATDDFLTNEEDTGLESCQDSLARENELTFSDKIMKVKAENIFRDSTFYHWCSSVIKGEVCSQLFFSFMPRNTLLAFMAMQSSPTWMFTPMMRIYSQLSGSMPSVLGAL